MADDIERKADDDDSETPDGVGIKRARAILGDLIARADYRNDRIVLTKNGRRAAALISIRDLEKLEALDPADASAA